jgi:hypothetical protein
MSKEPKLLGGTWHEAQSTVEEKTAWRGLEEPEISPDAAEARVSVAAPYPF